MAGTAEAARRAAGSLLESGKAKNIRVQQAVLVVGTALTYDYCPTGPAWSARLESGGLNWVPVPQPPERAAS